MCLPPEKAVGVGFFGYLLGQGFRGLFEGLVEVAVGALFAGGFDFAAGDAALKGRYLVWR